MWKWKNYQVKSIDKNNTKKIYTIEDDNNNQYTFTLKFYDLMKGIFDNDKKI